jgi:hypothetical protein
MKKLAPFLNNGSKMDGVLNKNITLWLNNVSLANLQQSFKLSLEVYACVQRASRSFQILDSAEGFPQGTKSGLKISIMKHRDLLARQETA